MVIIMFSGTFQVIQIITFYLILMLVYSYSAIWKGEKKITVTIITNKYLGCP